MSKFDELAKSFDKTKLNKRMDNMALEMFPDPNAKTQFFMPDMKTGTLKRTDVLKELDQNNFKELEKQIKNYNDNILTLDEDYTNQIPMHNIIVRCYHLEQEKQNGLYIPSSSPVRVMTQNGLGTLETKESKWAYSTKAVIVSVPDAFKPEFIGAGDIVQLDISVTLAEQRTKQDPMVLPYSYTLSDYRLISPPSHIENKHFGYLLVPIQSIITKLKK